MKTWEAGTRKALELWRKLPPEKRAELKEAASKKVLFFGEDMGLCGARVVEFDTRTKEVKVVSAWSQMDLYIHSPYVYLFHDEIPDEQEVAQ